MILDIIIDFFHLLATVIWIGGAIYINIVLIPSLDAIDPSQRGKLMGVAAKRFMVLAWSSIAILIITGIILTYQEIAGDLTKVAELAMIIKHVIVVLMIVIGFIMTWILTPKSHKLAPKPKEKPPQNFLKVQNNLQFFGQVNMILGILVLIFTVLI